MFVVNMADVAKSVRYSSKTKSKSDADCWNEPPNNQRDPEEYLSIGYFPANLKVKGQSSPEDPYDNSPTSKDEESSTDGASNVRVHVIRCDLICALIRLVRERYQERKLHLQVSWFLLSLNMYIPLCKARQEQDKHSDSALMSTSRARRRMKTR